MGYSYMDEKITIRADFLHTLLTIYNGLVVFILAAFMALTQEKICQSMWANKFLQQVPGLPMPSQDILAGTLMSFIILVCCGYLYSHAVNLPRLWRWLLFVLELGCCVFLMHSINLSYDGVVLLLVADLMYCYQGRYRLGMMLLAMLVLYGVIAYNASIIHPKAVPFELYAGYYNHALQEILSPLKNLMTYGNLIIFVVYMAVLLQEKSQEAEKIAGLNAQLQKSNSLLNSSNLQLNSSNKALYRANKKLREYAMTIASMAEIKERNRLAREIHDTLGHALTGIIAGLDAAVIMVDYAPEAAKKQLGGIREAAQRGIKDVRRSMHMLRPEDLEKLPLREAVGKVVREFGETSGMKINLKLEKLPEDLREDQTEVLYRIVQEALTNASRHGHASTADISIVCHGDVLSIAIKDNGVGCANIKKGFGLHHMSERVEMLGGSLSYGSNGGFWLEIQLPMNHKMS